MPSDFSPNRGYRVLVVDDDPSTLRLLEVILRDQGVEAIMACGSIAAQEWVREWGAASLDCALVDYRMPHVNGLEFLAWLVEIEPSLASVLMTAEGDMELVTGALRQGVADYVEKPFRRSDLLKSLDKAAAQTAERRHLMSAMEEVRDVTVIHSRLVPSRDVLPASFAHGRHPAFETAFHPAHEAGGDFVNCFPIDDERLLVVAGDVSGHDLKAGFVSSYFQGMCRGMIAMNASLAQVRAYFNDFLCREWNRQRSGDEAIDVLTSLSVCFLLFDFSRMSLSCLNNGFPLPTLCADDLSASELGSGGPPLGWFEDPETRELELPLPQTGSLVLSSDGLIDHAEARKLPFQAMADRLLAAQRQTTIRSLLDGQRDDVLVARLSWRKDGTSPAPRLLLTAVYAGNAAGNIDAFQGQWNAALELGVPTLSEERRREILLCCREALLNAMLHGSERRADRRCTMTIAHRPGSVSIRVDDEGHGYSFDPAGKAPPSGGDHISMGLRIIHCYATRCSTQRQGATLTMEFSTAPLTTT